MPLFEYECKECGEFNTFLIKARFTKKELKSTACENCQAFKLKSVISVSGCFVLKGEGFYKPAQKDVDIPS